MLSLAAKQVSGSSEEDGKACVTDLHAASPGPLGPHVSGKSLAFTSVEQGAVITVT